MVGHPSLLAILLGGFVAGTLDVGAAALINLASPVLILHFIAGGLLGKPALAGGASVALLGLVLQWAMSLIIAALYVAAARWLPVLRRRWMACGLAYGIVVFFVMNYVVVPLSAWAKWPRFSAEKFAENMLAMLLFGFIVAYFAQRCAADDSMRVGA
jgi:signal transduction histidine kinase